MNEKKDNKQTKRVRREGDVRKRKRSENRKKGGGGGEMD